MRIETGKFYRTRDGRMVGPMAYRFMSGNFTDGLLIWDYGGEHKSPEMDLIAEWSNDAPAPQPIDFSKIKVGDTVYVKARVDRVMADFVTYAGIPFGASEIVEHIPAPKTVRVGDLVREKCAQRQSVVLALHGEWAWVKACEYSDPFMVRRSAIEAA